MRRNMYKLNEEFRAMTAEEIAKDVIETFDKFTMRDYEDILMHLSRYVDKDSEHYLRNPSVIVTTDDGEPLSILPDELAGFEEYLLDRM